ncbi:MAG: PCRF domain-containing protein [Phycisphaerales bacterium]|nr:PCRF domain-containing protein [Phycisphaerales bacterium]MCB9837218.1 PCRF domain-containing protein [Phycisphaera sp.]
MGQVASQFQSMLPEAIAQKLARMDAQFAEMEAKLGEPEVMADHNAVRDLSIKRAAIEPVVDAYRELTRLRAEAEDLEAAIAGDDAELAELAREELPGLIEQATELVERVKASLVTADDRRVGSVILELRAGTGGDEAGLWCRDLLNMYAKYAAKKGWSFEEMDLTADPSVGGVRHAVINVKGEGVFVELGFEAGVHSVKRVPATETQGRVHTSTATVAVLPEPTEVEVAIDWANDVTEHVTTAQGPGGQNVNKVATAVHLIHNPTGIEVRMQESKSQAQNREKARRLLRARLYEIERDRQAAERAAERKGQIGTGGRSEKIRVYRYQDNIVADQRLDTKFQTTKIVVEADLAPMFEALVEQETARRLAEL